MIQRGEADPRPANGPLIGRPSSAIDLIVENWLRFASLARAVWLQNQLGSPGLADFAGSSFLDFIAENWVRSAKFVA
jgi:hypothetical protein